MKLLDKACLGVATARVEEARAGLRALKMELEALADAFAGDGPSDIVAELRRQARKVQSAERHLPITELVINADGSVEYSSQDASEEE